MKKVFILLILLLLLIFSKSKNYDSVIRTYSSDEFYLQISKYASYDDSRYDEYYLVYKNTSNIVYSLNKVNHPNFYNQDVLFDSFSFDGGIFVNKNHCLNKDSIPNNLVPVTLNKINRKKEIMQVDRLTQKMAKLLFDKAKSYGYELTVFSAYRSYHKQEDLYNNSVSKMFVAKPGLSEHQTGLALDISTKDAGLSEHFMYTKEYAFLKEYAYLYGFIERYPSNHQNITNYPFEPWHFRYVGTQIAKIIHDNDLTLEEYIYSYVEIK